MSASPGGSMVQDKAWTSLFTMSVRAHSASYLQRWLLRLVFVWAAVARGSGDCPKACICNVASEMHCTFRYLTAVPEPIQPHVERINFG